MNTEEDYLNNLLKGITEPQPGESDLELVTEEQQAVNDNSDFEEMSDILKTLEDEEIPKTSEIPEALAIDDIEETPEITEIPEDLAIDDIGETPENIETPEDLAIDDIGETLENIEIPEDLAIDDIGETPENIEIPEDLIIDEIEDTPEITEIPEDLAIDETEEIPEITEIPEDLAIDDIGETPEITEIPEDLTIDELEEKSNDKISSDISDEINWDELDLGMLSDENSQDSDKALESAKDEDYESDNDLNDVLSMLDDDSDIAEINDILKESDNNSPVQDEMMDLLNQMADDEAEMINAGVRNIEADDGGVAIPDMPVDLETSAGDDGENKTKALDKKGAAKDKEEKKQSALGRLFNILTEELPGPTEEDYAAEEAAKAAKKQEALTKKEQDKIAKDEEKAAKAEAKAEAKKAKAEAAAQKKKEKQAAKEAKKAKQEEENANKKAKRIPPKKLVAVAVFGVSVFGGVMVSSNVLSKQGYLNVARRAYYDKDYKDVYLSTYGMKLTGSDELIQKRSEVILKLQRRYDSYQNNKKLGRETEALDSLVQGLESYDYLNIEAEQYGVMDEFNNIKNNILDSLSSEYGLSEEQARALLNYEDASDYTKALNNIINGM